MTTRRSAVFIRAVFAPAAAVFFSICLTGCTSMNSPVVIGPGSPQDFPLPRTNSILPLLKGYHWIYTSSVYTESGEGMPPYVRMRQRLEISEVWGMTDDGSLRAINENTWNERYSLYCYAYEVDSLGYGDLLAYRLDLPVRGVYVMGMFHGTKTTLFDSPRLWLAYPAAPGFSYGLSLDSAQTAGDTTRMEVVSINEPFYFPDSLAQGVSPARFASCYLYRQTFRDTLCYYYYNENYGALGYRKYYGGVLRRTYMLRAFVNPTVYWRYAND